MKRFALGFQANQTDFTSECSVKTNVLAGKSAQLIASLKKFELDNWAAPLYVLSETSVASTDVFTYCQTTNFAKQFSTRMNSLAGLFDLGATVGVAFLKNWREPGKSDLYNSFTAVNNATTCETFAQAMGNTLRYTFSYEIAPVNYADQLGQNLVDSVFN